MRAPVSDITSVELAELLLDNTGDRMVVYVVQCGGDKVGAIPKTVRRTIPGAMGYCLITWGIAPDYVKGGYWRKELDDDSGMVIEIYELELEP